MVEGRRIGQELCSSGHSGTARAHSSSLGNTLSIALGVLISLHPEMGPSHTPRVGMETRTWDGLALCSPQVGAG